MESEADTQTRSSLGLIIGLTLGSVLFGSMSNLGAESEAIRRPKIGIALGGGAARGIAHIGILEWFEEHRIPVDYIAGTSMGGLIGGAYATGMTPEELRDLIRNEDWDMTFLGDTPYAEKDFRRKQDARDFPSKLQLGLRHGVGLPGGLDPAHMIGLLFSRIALPYSTIDSFDELPTRFRCVATDMETAEVLVLGDGSLALALRATMSIPAVFAPVDWQGRLLADGGLLNNVPTDVARMMGADIVIAVDVGSKLKTKAQLNSLLGNASQAIDVMMRSRIQEALKQADLVIAPDLEEFNSTDWRAGDALADRGYEAAAKKASELLKLSVSEKVWRRHQSQRESRLRTDELVPTFLLIEGVQPRLEPRIERVLQHHLYKPIDTASLEIDLTVITGWGLIESLRYEAVDTDGKHGLRIVGKEKSYGPPFVYFALGLENEPNQIDFNFGARLVALEVGGKKGSEIRATVGLGSTLGIGAEFYRPFLGPLFVAPRAGYKRSTDNLFEGDDLIAVTRKRRVWAGIDLGVAAGRKSEVRLGYVVANVESNVTVGDPLLPEADGEEQSAKFRWIFDGQDNAVVPSRGLRTEVLAYRYFEAPDATQDFTQGRFNFSAYWPWTKRDRVFVAGRAELTFKDPIPAFYEFTLGGALRLSSFNDDAFRGSDVLLAQAGYLRTIARLPDFVGGPIYLTGFFETGSAYDTFDEAKLHYSGSVGVLLETAVGPLFLGGSLGDQRSSRFYFILGRFIR